MELLVFRIGFIAVVSIILLFWHLRVVGEVQGQLAAKSAIPRKELLNQFVLCAQTCNFVYQLGLRSREDGVLIHLEL
jgi:hypothetical protein